jgi:hypothetical protein
MKITGSGLFETTRVDDIGLAGWLMDRFYASRLDLAIDQNRRETANLCSQCIDYANFSA